MKTKSPIKVNYQVLLSNQDVNSTLDKWKGQLVKVWSFTISHAVLEIRIINESKPNNYLRIFCGEVESIHGPMVWFNSHLEANKIGKRVILSDSGSGFEVHSDLIGVEEVLDAKM